MNATIEAIVARLPRRPLLSPRDIADAAGLGSTNAVCEAIARGQLAAARIGGRYVIAHEEAARWVRAQGVVSDER